MQWSNSSSRYGLVSILLHWVVALVVFGLFGLGLWMVGLDYYSSCACCGAWSVRHRRRQATTAN